jgi:hypothetical protein
MGTKSNSDIPVNPPVPDSFRIYSNSTSPVNFQPRAHFVGFIYAPLASIGASPNGNLYGALWGKRVSIQSGGEMYVDLDFLDGFVKPPEIVSWKRLAR